MAGALSALACIPVDEVRIDPELVPGARALLLVTGFPSPRGWAADLPTSQAVPIGLRGAEVELRYYRHTLAELGLPRGDVELQAEDNGCQLLPADARFKLEGARFVPSAENEAPLYAQDSTLWPTIQPGPPLLAATCARYSCLPTLTQTGCRVEVRASEVDCPQESTIHGRVDSTGQLHFSAPPNYEHCLELPKDAYSLGGIQCSTGVFGDCVIEAFHAAPPPLTLSVTVTLPLFPVGELPVYGFRPPITTAINDLAFSHGYVYATAQSAFDNSDCCVPDSRGGCVATDHALVRLEPTTMELQKFPGPCLTRLVADPQGEGLLAGDVRAHSVVRLSPSGQILGRSPPLWQDWASAKQSFFSAFGLSQDRRTLFVAIVNLDPAVRFSPLSRVVGLDTISLTVTASSSVIEDTQLISIDELRDGRLIGLDDKLDAVVRLEIHGASPDRTILIQHQAFVGMDLHFTEGHLLPMTEARELPWFVGLEADLNRLVFARAGVVAVPGRVDTLNLAPYESRGSPQSAVLLPSGELLVALAPPLIDGGGSAPGEAGLIRVSLGPLPRILPGTFPLSPLDHPIHQVGPMVAAPDGRVFGVLPSTAQIFRLQPR